MSTEVMQASQLFIVMFWSWQSGGLHLEFWSSLWSSCLLHVGTWTAFLVVSVTSESVNLWETEISLTEPRKLLPKTRRYINPPSRNLFSINFSYFCKLLTFRCQPSLNWLHDWRKQQEIGCIKCGSQQWKMWSAYFGQGNHLIFNLHHDSKVKPKCLQFRRVFCNFLHHR